MSQLDVFHLDLYELTDPCAGSGQKAYYKVPEQLVIPLEAVFEILICALRNIFPTIKCLWLSLSSHITSVKIVV